MSLGGQGNGQRRHLLHLLPQQRFHRLLFALRTFHDQLVVDLHDEPGLLSEILKIFADANANILTINSIVPVNGTAVVTISAETMDLTISLEELIARMRERSGVIKAEVLAG